jgi:hypothetical protein
MAGTINLSLTQQLDEFGQPLSGGALYLIQAGTVATAQNAFQDTNLTIPLPNPVILDAAGRIPQFFLADGFIKVRLQDRNGIVKFIADNLLVIGASAGGGGGGSTIDPTTQFQFGDLKARYDTAVINGWVRCNGNTIGNVGSPASELANASAQALFQYLWNSDPTNTILPVLPSRGASASSDWTNLKHITLPDWRGCTIAGLDTMGSVAANRLTTAFFGRDASVLGIASGSESNLLDATRIPAVTFSGTTGNDSPDHTHPNPNGFSGTLIGGLQGGGTYPNVYVGGTVSVNTSGASVRHQHAFSGAINGGGLAHANCQPTRVCTIYIKL